MKRIIFLAILLVSALQIKAQMIMSAEGINPENACNPGAVYFLFERKARPVEPKDSIERRLNEVVCATQDYELSESEFSIQCVINCKGEPGGGFHIVKSSGDIVFDNAVMDYLKTVTKWIPGKKNKRKVVDSWYMWRFRIEDGYIRIL